MATVRSINSCAKDRYTFLCLETNSILPSCPYSRSLFSIEQLAVPTIPLDASLCRMHLIPTSHNQIESRTIVFGHTITAFLLPQKDTVEPIMLNQYISYGQETEIRSPSPSMTLARKLRRLKRKKFLDAVGAEYMEKMTRRTECPSLEDEMVPNEEIFELQSLPSTVSHKSAGSESPETVVVQNEPRTDNLIKKFHETCPPIIKDLDEAPKRVVAPPRSVSGKNCRVGRAA